MYNNVKKERETERVTGNEKEKELDSEEEVSVSKLTRHKDTDR